MRIAVKMSGQREWVLPQRHFRMAAKKVHKTEQSGEEPPQQRQPEMERYLLQIDRQTKRSFNTPEAARSIALDVKGRFPALQVSIYDNLTKSRTLIEVGKSG